MFHVWRNYKLWKVYFDDISILREIDLLRNTNLFVSNDVAVYDLDAVLKSFGFF